MVVLSNRFSKISLLVINLFCCTFAFGHEYVLEVSPVQNRLNVTTNIPRASSKITDNAQMITFDLSNEQILVLSEPNNTLEIYMDNQGHMSVRHMNMTDTLRIKNNASDGNISFEGSKQKYAHKLILEGRSFFNKTDLSVDFLQASFSGFFINDKPLIINKIQGVVAENQQCAISAHNFINNNLLTIDQSLKCTIYDMFQNNSNIKGDGDLTIVTTKMLNDAQAQIDLKGTLDIGPTVDFRSIIKNREFAKIPDCCSDVSINRFMPSSDDGESSTFGQGFLLRERERGLDQSKLGRVKLKCGGLEDSYTKMGSKGAYTSCHDLLLLGSVNAGILKICGQHVALQGDINVDGDCVINAFQSFRNSGCLKVKKSLKFVVVPQFFNDVGSVISAGDVIEIRYPEVFVNCSGNIIGKSIILKAHKVINVRRYPSQRTDFTNDSDYYKKQVEEERFGSLIARNGDITIIADIFAQEANVLIASGNIKITVNKEFNNKARQLKRMVHTKLGTQRKYFALFPWTYVNVDISKNDWEPSGYVPSTIAAGEKVLVTIDGKTINFNQKDLKVDSAHFHNTGTIQGYTALELDAKSKTNAINGFTNQLVPAVFDPLPSSIDLSTNLILGDYEHSQNNSYYYTNPLIDESGVQKKIQDVAIVSTTVNQCTPLLMSPALESLSLQLALHEHVGRFRIPEFESDTAQLKELETNGLVYAIVHGALNPVEGYSWAPLPVDDGSSHAVARIDASKKHLLIKIPTRSRPEKFFATLDNFYKHLSGEVPCTFLITCDKDDTSMNNPAIIEKLKSYKNLHFYFGEGYSKVDAYNRDMQKHLDFDILLVASDDLEPLVHGFDKIMFDEMQKAFPDYNGVLRFESATSPHDINQYPVIGKKYYDRFAYIYHPDYLSLYCDNELVDVAQSFNCERVIRKPLLKHNHPLFVGGDLDDLYRANETPAIGKHDHDLYFERKRLGERNFGAKVDGGPTRMLEWRRQKYAEELAHQNIALPDNKKEIYRKLIQGVNGRLSPEEFEHRMEMLEAKTHTAVLTQEQIDTAPMPLIYYKKENRNGTVCLYPYLHVVKDVFEKLRHPEGLMEGKKVFLHGPQLEILNTGSIISFDKLEVKAESFTNQQRVQTTEKEVPQGFSETRKYTLRLPQEGTGIVLGLDIDISTNKDTINKGGTIQATQNVKLYSKEGNVVNTHEISEEVVQWDAGFWGKLFGKDGSSKSADFVKGKIQGGGDVSLLSEAGFVMNFASSIDAGGNLALDGFLGAVTESCASVYKTEDSTKWSGLSIKNVMKEAAKVGLARLSAKGNLKIHSKNLVRDRGSVVDADGDVTFNGEKGNDIKPFTFHTHSYEEVIGFDGEENSEPAGTFYKEQREKHTNQQSSLHRSGKAIRYITNGNNDIEIEDIISGEKVVFEAAGANNVNGVTRCVEIDSTKWSLRASAFGIPIFEPLFSDKFVEAIQGFAVADPFVRALIATISSKTWSEVGYRGAVNAGEFVRLVEHVMTNGKNHGNLATLIAQRLGLSPTISFRLGRVGKHEVICMTTPVNLKTPNVEFKSGRPSHYGDMVFDGTKAITVTGDDLVFDPGDKFSYKSATTDAGLSVSYVPGVGITGVGADYSSSEAENKQHSLVRMQAQTSNITATRNMKATNYIFGGPDTTVNITVDGDCIIATKPDEEYTKSFQGAFFVGFDGKSASGGFAAADGTTLTAVGQAGVAHGTKLKLTVKGKLTLVGAVLDGAPGSEIEANELEVKDIELKHEAESAQFGANYVGGNGVPLLGGISHERVSENRVLLHSVLGKNIKLKINKGLPADLFFDPNSAIQKIPSEYFFEGLPVIILDFDRLGELGREWLKMRDNAKLEAELKRKYWEALKKKEQEAKERTEHETNKKFQQQSNEPKPGQKTSDQKKSGDKKTEPGAEGKEHKDEPGKKHKPDEKSKSGDKKQKPDGEKEKTKDDTSSGEKQKPEAKKRDDSKAKAKEKSGDENQQDSKKLAKKGKHHKPGAKQNKPNKKPQQDAEPDDKHESKKQPKPEQTNKASGEKPKLHSNKKHESDETQFFQKGDKRKFVLEEALKRAHILSAEQYIDPKTGKQKNLAITVVPFEGLETADFLMKLDNALKNGGPNAILFSDKNGNVINNNDHYMQEAIRHYVYSHGTSDTNYMHSNPAWQEKLSYMMNNAAEIGFKVGLVVGVGLVIIGSAPASSIVAASLILDIGAGIQAAKRIADLYSNKDVLTSRPINREQIELELGLLAFYYGPRMAEYGASLLLRAYPNLFSLHGSFEAQPVHAGEGEFPQSGEPFNRESTWYSQENNGPQQSCGQQNGQMPKSGSTKPNPNLFNGLNENSLEALLANWHEGTFANKIESVVYHLDKHGRGRSALEYTNDAMNFYRQNKNLGVDVVLKNGVKGIKIQTKQLVEGKVIRIGGYWTHDGKVVTFWD